MGAALPLMSAALCSVPGPRTGQGASERGTGVHPFPGMAAHTGHPMDPSSARGVLSPFRGAAL